jgi:hypothetical protein
VLGAWRVTGDVDCELLIARPATADVEGELICQAGATGTASGPRVDQARLCLQFRA